VRGITRYRFAKWLAGIIILLLLPGMIGAFFAQVSSFLGVTVRGPIPDIAAILGQLVAFSRQLGFLLVVGGSLGVVLAFKAEDIPRAGGVLWYIHLVGHELVHALLAKLCGYHIREFKLTKHGGYVAYYKTNARGNFLISLGPYIFPLIPVILVLLAALVRGLPQQVVVLILGISLGSHLTETAREALDQYDVRQVGVLFSTSLILLGNIWLVVVVMAVVAPSRVSIFDFARDGFWLNRWYISSLLGQILSLFTR